MNIFKRFRKRDTKPDVRVVEVQSTELTLNQWRSTAELSMAAMRLSNDPTFRLMMAVMRNESPANWNLPWGAQPTDRIAKLSQIEGYHLALNNLESFAKPPDKESQPLESTFGTEPEPDEL